MGAFSPTVVVATLGLLTRALCGLGLCGLALAAAALGCSPGDVYLSRDGAGAAAPQSTAEASSSGGASATDVAHAESSETEFSQWGGADSGPPTLPGDSCPEDFIWCQPCETSRQCLAPRKFCDQALGACVECLAVEDCVRKYGQHRPLCSAGRCVECQTNTDCLLGRQCSLGNCIPEF